MERKRKMLLMVIIVAAAAAMIITIALGAFNHNRKEYNIELSEPPPGWSELGKEEVRLANEGAKELWKNNPSGTNYIDYIFTPPEGEESFGNIVISHVLRDGWLQTEQAEIPRIFFDSVPVDSLPSNDSMEETEECVAILNQNLIEGQDLSGKETSFFDAHGEEFYSKIDKIIIDTEPMNYGGAAIHIAMSAEVKYPGKDKQYRIVNLIYIFKEDYVFLISIECKGETISTEKSEALVGYFKENVAFR